MFPEEIRQLEQLQNMLQTMETMQEMTQTISALQEIFPDMSAAPPFGNDSAASPDGSTESAQTGGFSMMDMLLNMLTPEQKAMYEMFQQNTNASEPS